MLIDELYDDDVQKGRLYVPCPEDRVKRQQQQKMFVQHGKRSIKMYPRSVQKDQHDSDNDRQDVIDDVIVTPACTLLYVGQVRARRRSVR